jgi:hypothetical protein
MSGVTVFLDFNIGVENLSSRGMFISVHDLCFKFAAFFDLCAVLETQRKPNNRNIINSRGFEVIIVTKFIIEVMFNAFIPIL